MTQAKLTALELALAAESGDRYMAHMRGGSMTDTKTPPNPTTGCAPLGRPMAETVSLEVVWAAAWAAYYCRHTMSASDAADAAQEAVADLLAAHPRGDR